MIMYNSFAQSLLKKYGWTEGTGLGKSNQGITVPIKAHLKFNSHGISYKSIDSTQSDKWSNMYTTLTSNLQISDDSSITINRPVNNEEKLNDVGVNALYKSFIKSDVYLKDGIEVMETQNKKEKKSKKRKHSPENDEKTKKSKVETNNSEIVEIYKTKEKKKKKRELDESVGKTDIHCSEVDSVNPNVPKKDKKKKKKKAELDESESKISIHNAEVENVNSNVPKKDKKKIKLVKEKEISKTDLKKNCDDSENPKKKRSKNKEASLEKMKIVIPDSTFMTCHPAARCGLGMSGKLARIQKLHDQEKLKSLI